AKSAAAYLRAAGVAGDFFPRINAATMSLLAGNVEQARTLAKQVAQQVKAELTRAGKEQDYWLPATLAEAYMILGDPYKRRRWVPEGVQLEGANVGDIGAMRRNLLMLKEKLGCPENIWRLLNIGSVVAFSGHMIDHPRRTTRNGHVARFPPDAALERRVG